MNKEKTSFSCTLLLTYGLISAGSLIFFLPTIFLRAEAIIHSIKPASGKLNSAPYHPLSPYYQSKKKKPLYVKRPTLTNKNIFQIEASDAIDDIRYSQPDIAFTLLNLNSEAEVPSSTVLKHNFSLHITSQNSSPTNIQEQIYPTVHSSDKLKLLRDIRYLDTDVDDRISTGSTDRNSNYKLNKKIETKQEIEKFDAHISSLNIQTKTNFNDSGDNLLSLSSDAVLSYEIPASEFNDSDFKNSSMKQNIDILDDAFSHINPVTSIPKLKPVTITMQPDHTIPSSVHLSIHIYTNYINNTNLNDSISTDIYPALNNNENVTNSLPSMKSEKISSGTVAGIVIAVLLSVTLLSSAVIYLLYRKFNGKCASVVEIKFNNDNCGYLDDSLYSSIYLNNHIELPKESSEEMTSLDNDSFLNSLETMTIQNYWADNSKITKILAT